MKPMGYILGMGKSSTPENPIATARQKRGWTQTDLAERVNMHRVSLSRIEAGTREPSLPAMAAIADALGEDFNRLARAYLWWRELQKQEESKRKE